MIPSGSAEGVQAVWLNRHHLGLSFMMLVGDWMEFLVQMILIGIINDLAPIPHFENFSPAWVSSIPRDAIVEGILMIVPTTYHQHAALHQREAVSFPSELGFWLVRDVAVVWGRAREQLDACEYIRVTVASIARSKLAASHYYLSWRRYPLQISSLHVYLFGLRILTFFLAPQVL